MIHIKSAVMLFGLLSALGACDDTPTRDLTAPDPEAAALTVSNTWSTRRSGFLPARADMKAGTIHNIIYLVGGDTRHAGSRALVNVEAYNVATNTWSRRRQLPDGRSAIHGASAIGGKLYVSGGLKILPPGSFRETRTLFVYNPVTNTWVRKADMPAAGFDGAQGVIGGRLYVYVGNDFFTSGDHFFRYNPATNTWVTLPRPPVQHASGMGGVINGKFYLVGGFGFFSDANATLNVYDPATNTWTTKASMTEPRLHLAGGVIKGKLYVAGGSTIGKTGGFTVRATLEVYNPATDRWTRKRSMPTARSSAAGAVASGRLFVIGGDLGPAGGPQTTKVEAYTP